MTDLKARWANGESVVGAWATLGSSLATETLSRSGFDYVCIDTQHGANDYSSTVSQLQAIDCGSAAPIIRVPWNEPGIIGKSLDAGADGIIIPMVNSVAEAEAAVRACRYAPAGARSFGPVRAGVRNPDYYATANEHVVVCIPMIETVQAVAALDEILSVPGIDAVYVGPADLSVTLGLPPGNNDDEPSFMQALEAIVAGCNKHGVVPGMHSTPALVPKRLDMGFRMLTAIADNVAMNVGLTDAVAVVPGASSATGDSGDAMY